MTRPLPIDPSALAEEIQVTIEELNRLTALAAEMLLKVEIVVFTEDWAPRPDRTFLEARISFGR